MRNTFSFTPREIKFFIFSSMIFAVCEMLSIELNNFFNVINIYGYQFCLNPSVIFFCLGFFIIDLVTEIYNDKYAAYFIYSKIVSQLVFMGLGMFGVIAAGISEGQIAQTFFIAPRILINSMVASFFGYRLTGKLMELLKIKLEGRFLFSRYLASTVPGEIVFSLIFALLSFSHGNNFVKLLNIIFGLIATKFLFSVIFSLLVLPITNSIKNYLGRFGQDEIIKTLPFPFD